MDLEKLKYPIGHFKKPEIIDDSVLKQWLNSIKSLPERVRSITSGLSDVQFALPYRPEGWNIKEVVHHIPDSHLNAYIRVKWTLTENQPTIKAYNEAKWANLFDSQNGAIELSLKLLESLHERWVFLLSNLSPEQLELSYYHPEDDEYVSMKVLIGKYAWHGEHHLAHIHQALNNA